MKYKSGFSKFSILILSSLLFQTIVTGCQKTDPSLGGNSPQSESPKVDAPDFAFVKDLAGRATSSDTFSSLSFNVPIPDLTPEEMKIHLAGDAEFSRQFTTASGLGPAFNSSSCVSCHARDGRGALPVIPDGQTSVKFGPSESLLLRVSQRGERGYELIPGFTEQLFQRGIFSLRPDSPATGQADVDMSFTYQVFTYPDGTQIELRTPKFSISNAYDGPQSPIHGPQVRISPRIGPPLIGLGLLDAVSEQDLLSLEDPTDKNGDGISGRANFNGTSAGRFGWKAGNTSIRNQVAAALSNDMGLRNPLFPKENIEGTKLYEDFVSRLGINWKPLEVEISESQLDVLEFYTSTLAVPARRDVMNPQVLNGAKLFETIGCTGCHSPQQRTSATAKIPALRNITIYPFTDGLLHDMGMPLADHRPELKANGREWKTPALWGIGLAQVVNPRAGFLHDGRARTLEEAVVFHGGEAEGSKLKFTQLPKSERASLILFLKSL